MLGSFLSRDPARHANTAFDRPKMQRSTGFRGWSASLALALSFGCSADNTLDESISLAGGVLPPRNPRAADTTSTSGRIVFSWDASLTAGVDRYETSVTATGEPSQTANVGLNLTTTIRVVTDGVYQLRARACKLLDCSAWTTPVQVTVMLRFPDYLESTCTGVPDTVPAQQPVGVVEGSATVSGGTSSYRIPVVAPPGRRGMQPSIELSYSQQGGNSQLGVGWSLTGISRITRCPKSVAVDGELREISLTREDAVCLDGQRLLIVNDGVLTAEYRTEIDTFQKIIRQGSVDDPNSYFEVHDKSGTISYYGAYQGAIATEVGGQYSVPVSWWIRLTKDHQNNSIIYNYELGDGEIWITQIYYTGTDLTMGNREFVFSYDNIRPDKSTSYAAGVRSRLSRRLTGITTKAAGNVVRQYNLTYGESRATKRSLLHSVEECSSAACRPQTIFTYQDAEPTYVEEMLVHGSGETVEINLGSDFDGDGIRDYVRRENNHPWGGATAVSSTLYYTADGTTENLLNSTWDDHYDRVIRRGVNSMDFDRDGIADQIGVVDGYFTIHSLGNDKTSNVEISETDGVYETADFDGNGFTDILFHHVGVSENRRIYFQCPPGSSQDLIFCDSAEVTVPESMTIASVDDFNGDGIADLFLDWDGGGALASNRSPPLEPKIIYVHKHNGVAWFEDRELPAFGGPLGSFAEHGDRGFADINGDGLPDIYRIYGGGPVYVEVWLNRGDGTFSARTVSGQINMWYEHKPDVLVFDQDLDGHVDFLVPDPWRRAAHDYCFEQRNPQTGDEVTYCSNDPWPTNFQSPGAPANNDFTAYFWDAVHLDEDANGNFVVRQNDTGIAVAKGRAFAEDHFGDGLTDVRFRLKNAWVENSHQENVALGYYGLEDSDLGTKVSRNMGPAPDLLAGVVDGLGRSSEWEYRPLSSTGSTECPMPSGARFYSVDHTSATDRTQVPFASSMYVVARFEESDGIGGARKKCYRYEDALANSLGRGFEGFHRIIEEEAFGDQLDLRTTTTFKQTFPLIGAVESVKVGRTSDSASRAPIEQINNTWEQNCVLDLDPSTAGGSICFPYIASTITTTRDLIGRGWVSTSTKTIQYSTEDMPYGNVSVETLRIADRSSHYETTTSYDYETPDTASWWVSRLRQKVVSASAAEFSSAPTMAPVTSFPENDRKLVTTDFDYYPDSDPWARLPRQTTIQPGSTTEMLRVDFESYDATGNLLQETATGSNIAEPRTTKYTYSADKYFVASHKNPYDHESLFEYDAKTGRRTGERNPNLAWSRNTLDEFGIVTEVATPDRISPVHHRLAWCSPIENCPSRAKFVVTEIGDGMPVTRSYIDQLGRTLRKTQTGFSAPQIAAVGYAYDSRGHLISQLEPSFSSAEQTIFQGFDALGRPSRKIVSKKGYKDRTGAPDETFTVDYSYWAATTTIVLDGRLTASRTVDSQKRVVETTDTGNVRTKYRYDGAGRPILIEDSAGNRWRSMFGNTGHELSQTDPDRGASTFTYNAAGELLSVLDGNNRLISFERDSLGRIKTRLVDGRIDAKWFFDTGTKGFLDNEQRLDPQTHAVVFQRDYTYDNIGRPRTETERFDNKTFTLSRAYGCNGQLNGAEYPSRDAVEYKYSDYGYLLKEQDPLAPLAPFVYREVLQMSARGQVEIEKYGNNLFGRREYFESTGQTKRICVGTDASCANPRQDLVYQYDDPYGNLTSQTRKFGATFPGQPNPRIQQVSETYQYDTRQRLKRADRAWVGGSFAPNSTSYDFNDLGNLTLKSDYVNSYTYGTSARSAPENAGPHAVRSIIKASGQTVADFRYDGNGNEIQGDGRTITYDLMNLPTRIVEGSVTTNFLYDASGDRYRQDAGTKITRYFDSVYEEVTNGSSVEQHAYVGLVEIVRTSVARRVYYLHLDRLDSLDTVTDDTGSIIEARNFDAFGKPRGDFWEDNNGQIGPSLTTHGFTGHEHLDQHRLIHMNGRVYDPFLGRFLSVDPVISEPENLQSFNAYSYVMNNPFGYTDPTGFETTAHGKEVLLLAKYEDEHGKIVGLEFRRGNGADAEIVRVFFLESSDFGRPGSSCPSFACHGGPKGREDSVGAIIAMMSAPFTDLHDRAGQAVLDLTGSSVLATGAAMAAEFIIGNPGAVAALPLAPGQMMGAATGGIGNDAFDAVQGFREGNIKKGGDALSSALGNSANILAIVAGVGAAGLQAAEVYRGGPYSETKLPVGDGKEAHHMPPQSVSPLSAGEGPSIQMDPFDHRSTLSHGSQGEVGKVYRKEIQSLLDQGKWRSAIAREIRDVRRVSLENWGARRKYNSAMREMLDYAERRGLLKE